MKDLISREAALKCFHSWVNQYGDVYTPDEMPEYQAIEALPSAQSESKKGKWIEAYDPFNRISGRCSVCGWEAHLYEDDVVGMNYCPNCGADMRGEQDE